MQHLSTGDPEGEQREFPTIQDNEFSDENLQHNE